MPGPVTGVPNRAYMEAHLQESLAAFELDHSHFSVLVMETDRMDHFRTTDRFVWRNRMQGGRYAGTADGTGGKFSHREYCDRRKLRDGICVAMAQRCAVFWMDCFRRAEQQCSRLLE